MQHVGVDRRHVDRPVRAIVHRVDPRERACLMRERGDLRDRGQRPDRIRGPRERDDARPVAQDRPEVVEVEPAVVVDVAEPYDEPAVVGQLEPRRDVRVVVEPRHDDLVPGGPVPRRRARQREVQRRHVLAEDHLVRRGAEKLGRRLPRPGHERVRPQRRLEGAAEVRIRFAQVGRDGIDHRVRHLRPARAVEERERTVECREARPDRLDPQRRRAARHATRHSYRGEIVSDAPTKQSRSAFANRSSTSVVRGETSASMVHPMSTKA